jgi:hypothetical protein
MSIGKNIGMPGRCMSFDVLHLISLPFRIYSSSQSYIRTWEYEFEFEFGASCLWDGAELHAWARAPVSIASCFTQLELKEWYINTASLQRILTKENYYVTSCFFNFISTIRTHIREGHFMYLLISIGQILDPWRAFPLQESGN